MKLNDFFEAIYVISLTRRFDRRLATTVMLKNQDIDFEFYDAIDGIDLDKDFVANSGIFASELACRMSHLNVIKLAKQRDLVNVLILEDDAEISRTFSADFAAWSRQVPEDWQLLYLSGNHSTCKEDGKGWYPVRPNIMRIKHTLTTAAWSCNCQIYDTIIERLSNGTKQVDLELCEIQLIVPAYAFKPSLITQRDGFSDIQGCKVSYKGIVT